MGRLDLSWRRRSGALEWGLALLQANRERLALYGPSEAGVLRFDSRRSARALLSWETR